jgi:antitoxin component YwqK of YwqJK toxin-antitoxin module
MTSTAHLTRRLCGIALLVLIGTAPAAAQTPSTVLTPALTDTLRADQVEQDNGFTTVRATGAPFTGIVVDVYASGAKQLRRSVVEGLPEGLWMEWYENGVPRYMATWQGGRGEGVWTYFHATGEIRERVLVTGDVYDGPVEGWHANGQKAFEGHNRANQKDGRWRYWDEAGRMTKVDVYRDGTLLSTRTP